jgi:hypothetical protein
MGVRGFEQATGGVNETGGGGWAFVEVRWA